jgi:predicted nucleic acid-binding protein
VSYLLDTNVLSETVRPRPDQTVIDWLDSVATESLHVSVLSLGEIRAGLEGVRVGSAKRERLRLWLEQAVSGWFESRLLPVDAAVADRWGRLEAQTRAEGRPLPAIDSLLAATALTHNLRLVTRNTRNFDVPGLELVNPWRA